MDNIITFFELVGDLSQSIQTLETDIAWQFIEGRQLVKRDIETIDMGIRQTRRYFECPSSDYTNQQSVPGYYGHDFVTLCQSPHRQFLN